MNPPASATWIRLTWVVPQDLVEHLEAVLGELGALAVSSADAEDGTWIETLPGEPTPWSRVRLQALFPDSVDAAEVHAKAGRALAAHAPADEVPHGEDHGVTHGAMHGASLPAPEIETLADRDWVREAHKHARPRQFGRRLWVCPTTAELPKTSHPSSSRPAGSQPTAADESVVLRIDPGLGFGSGSHESTALCLEWLEARDPRGLDVIDYGCGSGILGIAALLLGAHALRVCDLDPHALDASRDNAARNEVASRIWVGSPEDMPHTPADLIVANIMADTLCVLAPTFAQLQSPGAELILSGVLAHQGHDVEAAHATWYDTHLWRQRGDWVLVHARRTSARVDPK